MPGWLYRVLLVMWVGGVILGYGFWYSPESEDSQSSASWSLLRESDVALTLAQEAGTLPTIVQWVVVGRDTKGMLEHVKSEMDRHAEADLLDEDGIEARRLVTALVEGEAGSLDFAALRGRIEEQGAWEWERLAVKAASPGEVPEWFVEQEEYSAVNGGEMMRRALLGEALWWVIFFLGAPFIPDALRCFRPSQHRKWSLATKVWRPRWALGAYFASLVISGILFWDYLIVPAFLWDVAYMPTWIASDAVWRLASVALMLPFLMVRMRDLPRILGLDRLPDWRPVLGMFSLAFVYDWILFLLLRDYGAESLGQGTSWAEDGWWGLTFSITSGVILAPVVEEIVFRGMLFNALSRGRRFWWAMGISTILFVFIHYYDVYGSLSVASFGVAACALYRGTGSLWTAVLYHALVNGVITVSMWPVYHGMYSG